MLPTVRKMLRLLQQQQQQQQQQQLIALLEQLQRAKLFVLLVVVAVVLLGSSCGPQVGDVACSGALPITCSCAQSCALELDGGVTIVEFKPGSMPECIAKVTPRCWRRDR